MKLSSEEFRELFTKSGSKVSSKGRPIIDPDILMTDIETLHKGNKKVINATKVRDVDGNVVADSRWEHRCKTFMEDAKLDFDFQKTFLLLPTIKKEGFATLRKRTWTPDFCFEQHKIVADAKGHTTEMAKIKIHLFCHLYPEWDVFILRTDSELLTFINKIKQRENE